MKLNKKIIINVIIMFLILIILPLILTSFSKPHEFMGIMILLFFIINPIFSFIINFIVGKDVKRMWYMPILFSLIFLISYWIILSEVIIDLLFYAFIYIIIGYISIFISFLLSNKRGRYEK